MQIRLIGKKLDTSPLYNKIVQGEAGADSVEIILPRHYEGLDLSGYSFSIRTVSEADVVAEQVLSKTASETEVKLSWSVTSDFTSSSGRTKILLTGISPDAETTVKFVGRDINVLPDVNGSVQPAADVIAQALAQVQLEVQRAIDAADDAAGLSAYEVAVKAGFSGTEEEWLASLKGETGDTGSTGATGFSPTATVTKSGAVATLTVTDINGTTTTTISDGDGGGSDNVWYPAISSVDGGVLISWSKQATLTPPAVTALTNGINGTDGADGQDGNDGASAYDIAVSGGFSGTEAEWLASLKGDTGEDGATVSVNNIENVSGNISLTLDDIPDGTERTLGSGSDLPVGSVMMTASVEAPSKWLFCRGQTISRTTYAELFTAIGTIYGAGDGSTTFSLPNLCGKVPVGLDSTDSSFDSLGETGGEKSHTLSLSEIPAHTHSTLGTNQQAYMAFGSGNTYFGNVPTGSSGGGGSHNNLQPYITLNYIIFAGV